MHHCSDETLLSHLDAELDTASDKIVVDHLGACWSCRNRLAILERQIHRLVEVSERGTFPGPLWRNAAQAKLELRMAEYCISNPTERLSKRHWLKFLLPTFGRTAWVTSLIIVVLIAGGALLLMPPQIEAKATLLRSVEAERQALSQLRAQRKTWKVEQYSAGRIVARRHVEHWQGANAIPAALRVYDERQMLVGGEWISKSGSRTRYRKGHTPVAVTAESDKSAPPGDMDEAGLFKLSAQGFLDLTGNGLQAEIHKDGDSLVVEFAAHAFTTNNGTPRLLKATLVLTEDGLHPTSGILMVDSASGHTEYRLQETGLERYVNEAPPAHVFDQESIAEESAPLVASTSPGNLLPVVTLITPEPAMPASTNPALEVRIIQQLALENVTLGEQVQLERKQDGTMDLHVHVASEEKKLRMEAGLASLIAEGGWKVDFTIGPEEQVNPGQLADPRALRQWANDKLQSTGATPTEENVERLAREEVVRLTNNVHRLRNHAIAIREIGGRFRQADLDQLSEDQRDGWRTAVFQHIQALQTETISLQRELTAISNSPSPEHLPPSLKGPMTVRSVVQDVEHIDQAMKALFNAALKRSASGVDQNQELLRLVQLCQMRLEALAPVFEVR